MRTEREWGRKGGKREGEREGKRGDEGDSDGKKKGRKRWGSGREGKGERERRESARVKKSEGVWMKRRRERGRTEGRTGRHLCRD